MAEPVALAALMLDAAIGWPRLLYRGIGHPVGGFAGVITWCERRWNRPDQHEISRRLAGAATVLLLIALAGGGGAFLQSLLLSNLGSLGWLAVALAAFPALAQRSLYDHVRPVAAALRTGDLSSARSEVGMIVGRDTQALDEKGVARAAIESLAESFCDGIAAPLFWLLLMGLPGVWVYKAINTADSLIGHRERRWRAFGWAAARTDDLMNLIPARIAGAVICIAGLGGWRTMWRHARYHASPNAGWPEAAMAGVLKVRLAGPIAYDGLMHQKPWIGHGTADVSLQDLNRALAVYVRACFILWIIAGGIAWAL
jgi:adenosylcobinamide-phosphate synthase